MSDSAKEEPRKFSPRFDEREEPEKDQGAAETLPRPSITVEMLESELAAVNSRPLHGSAFGLYQIVVALKDMLKSGEYALLSKKDREDALKAAFAEPATGHHAQWLGDEARRLLQVGSEDHSSNAKRTGEWARAQRDQHTLKVASGVSIERRQEEETP